MIYILLILGSITAFAQEEPEITEEYALVFVRPKAFKQYIADGRDIKVKDISVALPGDKIELFSSQLGLKHKGFIDSIGTDYVILDGIRYEESDITNVVLVQGNFPGARALNALMKVTAVLYGIGGLGLTVAGEPGGGTIVLGISAGLWILSNRLGGIFRTDGYIENEQQFKIKKLELDPAGLPKD